MPSGLAMELLMMLRLDCVAPLTSLNFGCSATWPVTVAPAIVAAFVTPCTTELCAPGSVTMTSLSPVSRPPSSRGSDVCRNVSPALAWPRTRRVAPARR